MENKKATVNLTGIWRIIRKFTTNGSNEQNLVVFGHDPDYIVGFPTEGIVTERCGNGVSTIMYHYDPETKLISLQPSGRPQPSPISGREDNTFRIIPLNDREMYFKSPPSVEDDSAGDEFEIILLERV